MPRTFARPLGFFLTFTALFAFILHPNHLNFGSDGRSSSHCCVCHTVPMGAARSAIDQTPIVYVAYDLVVTARARPRNFLFMSDTPRGPPETKA